MISFILEPLIVICIDLVMPENEIDESKRLEEARLWLKLDIEMENNSNISLP